VDWGLCVDDVATATRGCGAGVKSAAPTGLELDNTAHPALKRRAIRCPSRFVGLGQFAVGLSVSFRFHGVRQ
jgi:hypothetical protein